MGRAFLKQKGVVQQLNTPLFVMLCVRTNVCRAVVSEFFLRKASVLHFQRMEVLTVGLQ